MNTRTFFFNENSKKSKINELLGKSAKGLEEYIKIITSMQSGNKIGYFQFLYKDTYYKFYIMPKIHKVEEGECNNCPEYQKQFIKFFKHYYHLVGKYDINKYANELEGNISDLSYKSEESAKELASDDITDVDDFIVHNYDDSLAVIESFFTKHKKQILVEQKFESQSIQSKLDIRRNIIEPNKSNLHQTKNVPMIYSNIAVIAIEILKYFINMKVRNFSATTKSEVLKRRANKIQNSLKQKFPNNHDLTFKIKEILLQNTSKLFEKNNEYKLVYKALLKLTGKEHYYNGDVCREIQKEDEMISIFFQPEKLYEWIVYDKLVESKEFDEVLKDDKDYKKEDYFLNPIGENTNIISPIKGISKPDLIGIKNGIKYIIDAKWKILPKNKSDYPIESDILKLRRDAKIKKTNKGYLIYPHREKGCEFQLKTKYSYSYDDFIFELRVVNVVE